MYRFFLSLFLFTLFTGSNLQASVYRDIGNIESFQVTFPSKFELDPEEQDFKDGFLDVEWARRSPTKMISLSYIPYKQDQNNAYIDIAESSWANLPDHSDSSTGIYLDFSKYSQEQFTKRLAKIMKAEHRFYLEDTGISPEKVKPKFSSVKRGDLNIISMHYQFSPGIRMNGEAFPFTDIYNTKIISKKNVYDITAAGVSAKEYNDFLAGFKIH